MASVVIENLTSKAARGDAPVAVAVGRSKNRKVGDAAATYAAQASCPAACVFKDGGGCYAEAGSVGKFVTAPLNVAGAGMTALAVAKAEARAIDACEVPAAGWPMRLHTVGDCATPAAARVVAAAAARWLERGGGPVWTYTHAWRKVPRDAWEPVSVLASCETAVDVRAARRRGYVPALTVAAFPGRRSFVPAGMKGKAVPCPAMTTKGVTCASCRLCLDDGRLRQLGLVIAFEVHGTPLVVSKALRALSEPDAPDRRLTTRELIPRILAAEPELELLGFVARNQALADRCGVSPSSVRQMLRRMARERQTVRVDAYGSAA